MLDAFLYAGMPYIALTLMVLGSWYRYKTQRFSYSSLGSQFLESRWLLWASVPWHVGVIILFVGHLLPVLAPGLWQSLTAHPWFLIAVETIGAIAAMLCLAGLAVFLGRRIFSARVQAVTSPADLIVLTLLMCQVLLGLTTAANYRWGSAWSTNTTTPYLWSLMTLQPDTALVAGLPPVVRLHIVFAWILFLTVPFTRLVHMFSIPAGYLWRAPQKVVWTSVRRAEAIRETREQAIESRRYFLRGALGAGAAASLLFAGVLDKLANFFMGPSMKPAEEAELITKKLQRLELTAQQRELELERMNSPYIFVSRLAELSAKDGKYFTDYQMRPALAFKDAAGMPLLISAKCTHLGCTVASTLDNNGRLMCPCHISYFDVKTGQPNPGAPAKAPLPKLGWVLMDDQGNLVMSQGPDGVLKGQADPARLDSYSLFIAKQFEETA